MQRTYIKQITKIQELFCQTEEARKALRVTTEEDDALIESQLEAAIDFAENFLRLNIVRREIVAIYKNVNSDEISLEAFPIASIEQVKFAGEGPLEEDDYSFYKDKIKFKNRIHNKTLEVKYISGFEVVPESIRQGIFLHLNILYDKEIMDSENMESILQLYKPYRRLRL